MQLIRRRTIRCKACNNALNNPRDRTVDGYTFVENLCPKCIEIALSSIYSPDLDDDSLLALSLVELSHEDTEV